MVLLMKYTKYRSCSEIIYRTLSSISELGGGTAGIARIMHNSFASHKQYAKYLHEMVWLGMITYDDGSGLYKIGEEGA